MRKFVGIVVAALVLAGPALAGGKAFTAAETARATKAAAAARVQFNRQLLDYPSARFRDVLAYVPAEGDAVFCGYVNSRNRLGAYVGWSRFLYFSGALRISEAEGGDIAVNAICDANAERDNADLKDWAAALTHR